MEEHHQMPIWFFIGALLLVYGILILGVGLYEINHPPEKLPPLWEYHANVWWGGLLTLIGLIYCLRFNPLWKKK
jgi:hypothetical protein